MNVVVTGGGTIAPIDDVRHVANASTGRFSAQITEACLASAAPVWHVHVPEPALAGRVKHRLCAQIQHRFREAGIVLPLPTRTVHLHAAMPDLAISAANMRVHAPSAIPSPHHHAAVHAPSEPMNRCVDE